jgi:hypothetical protein
MRSGILGCNAVEVPAKQDKVHAGSTPEHGDGGVGGHKTVPTKGGQLADGCAIAGDDEGLAMIEPAHDLPALVPELPLSDDSGHTEV